MNPICMYKLLGVCEKGKMRDTTVYGQVLEVNYNYNRKNNKIQNQDDKKVWVTLQLAGVSFTRSAVFNATLPGYDYIREKVGNIQDFHVYGKVKVLVQLNDDLTRNNIVGKLIKVKDATWFTEHFTPNEFYITRFSKPINGEFYLIALEIEKQDGTEEFFKDTLDGFGNVRADLSTADNPGCGEKCVLPPRLQPAATRVDLELQTINSPTASLNGSTRTDGSKAVESSTEIYRGDLGVSGNGWNTTKTEPFKKINKIEERTEFKEFVIRDIETNINKAKELLNHISNELSLKIAEKDRLTQSSFEQDMATLGGILKYFWKSKPDGDVSARTGRQIFLDSVEKAIPELGKHSKDNDTPLATYLNMLNKEEDIVDVMIGVETDVEEDIYLIYKRRYHIYLAMLRSILGIKCDLMKIFDLVDDLPLMDYIININPYVLSYIHSKTTMRDMDRLAMHTIYFGSEEQTEARCVAAILGFMRGTTTGMGDGYGSTIFTHTEIKEQARKAVTVKMTAEEYSNFRTNGSILTRGKVKEYITYINEDIKARCCSVYGNNEWRQNSKGEWERKLLTATGNTLNEEAVINTAVNKGMCVKITYKDRDYYGDTRIVEKNLNIYRRLKRLCSTAATEKMSEATLATTILMYEQGKRHSGEIENFRLEEQQTRCLQLLHNGVLAITGLAGSGKTTAAEAIVYVLEKIYNLNSDDILFVAPTGKAANRLRESVKRPTSTIHRAFRVGVTDGMVNEMNVQGTAKNKTNAKVLIVDEASMISLDLMSTLLDNVSDETKIIFLGDIEQLPPISIGKPFSDILHFVPTVMLKTSKRAEENSLVFKNANKLLHTADELTDGKDFRIIECRENDVIVGKITEMLRFYATGEETTVPVIEEMKGMGLRDIQIITPFKKKQYCGTARLNNELHDIFNKYDGNSYRIEIGEEAYSRHLEIREGDRVIHTENFATSPHYELEGNIVRKKETKGVMNGDVGYVKAILPVTDLYFEDSKVEEDFYSDISRDRLSKTFVIFVEYMGVGTDDNFLIAYTVYAKEIQGTLIKVVAQELGTLDLAFALTIHKMQGSQSKNIIVIWPPISIGMMTKNMLYTAITRASKGVTLIGSVKGNKSALQRARYLEDMSKRLSLIDILS